ncbi:MAG: glycosyltransferase family 39 protein [Magnetococcales bacterium]|nr:glycosyltransferase family 39 protein [Magnetococcales bacterium]
MLKPTPFSSLSSWKQTLLIVLFLEIGALILFGGHAGSYALWDPWEPKYPHTVGNMLERNDLLTPYYDDKPRWTKPPLHYWVMLPGIAAFGQSAFMARLPSIIAATLGVIGVFLILARLFDRTTGIIAALVLASIPQYAAMARQAMPDMLMTFFLLAAMISLALARFDKGVSSRWSLLFYLFLGFAFMTKGPVTLAIAVGALLVDATWYFSNRGTSPPTTYGARYFILFKEIWRGALRHKLLLGSALFMVIVVPWYALTWWEYGTHFTAALNFENLQRFREPVREHNGLVGYYVTTFFQGMLPWSALLLAGLPALLHANSRKTADLDTPTRHTTDDQRIIWYFFSWFIATFFIFTAAGTKLPHYLLPLTPSVAILVAILLRLILTGRDSPRLSRIYPVAALLLILPFRDFNMEGNKYLLYNFTIIDREILHIPNLDNLLVILCLVWISLMVWAFFNRQSRRTVAMILLVALLNVFYLSHHIIPGHFTGRDITPHLAHKADIQGPDSEILFVGSIQTSHDYTLTFHQSAPVRRIPASRADRRLMPVIREVDDLYIITGKWNLMTLLTLLSKHGIREEWTIFDHPDSWYLMLYRIPQNEG